MCVIVSLLTYLPCNTSRRFIFVGSNEGWLSERLATLSLIMKIKGRTYIMITNRNRLLIFIMAIGIFGILNTQMGIIGIKIPLHWRVLPRCVSKFFATPHEARHSLVPWIQLTMRQDSLLLRPVDLLRYVLHSFSHGFSRWISPSSAC
jgi:hypothetical protein